MIPFGSQRGLGQDLATHLLNAHDNEILELADIRGSLANDLHGAFEEWEIQAHAVTKCQKYLYSLSINPDPRQGELTREQYLDYIGRVEEKLDLTDQPRAIIFHEKNGREHAHVVFSRIDAKNERAVHIAFDRQKLMMVTREFARDHGLELPKGYEKGGENKQQSLYEKAQQDQTGISRQDRIEEVTSAWRQSDSPRAFVNALEECGYILATGKRPYVLVDIYGHMNALSKLVDDDNVKTKDIKAFLEGAYPAHSLPTVDEARTLAAQHNQARADFVRNEQEETALEELKHYQQDRRQNLDNQYQVLREKHNKEQHAVYQRQKTARSNLNRAYLAKSKWIRQQRYEKGPTGLAEFLGRVSGINHLRKKVQRYQDKKRLREYLLEKLKLKSKQEQEKEKLKQHQILQKRDLERQLRDLRKVDKREEKSLETELTREQRIMDRSGLYHLPPFAVDRTPSPREMGELSVEHNTASGIRTKIRHEGQLSAEFDHAAQGKQKAGEGEKKSPMKKRSRRQRRRKDRENDPGRER